MNKRSLMKLIIFIVVIGVLGYGMFGNVAFGIFRIKPMYELIKQGLDLTGGVSAVYEIANAEDVSAENLRLAADVFRTRLDFEGYTEATITEQGNNRLRIEIPLNKSLGNVNPNEITSYLVATARVMFVDPEENIVFEGKDMEDVYVTQDQAGAYAVGFQLNESASYDFAAATAKYKGQAISILMDETVISSPTVNDVISGGRGIITGNFTYDGAVRLANQIKSGVMPVEMSELEVRAISATLGEEALSRGLLAGAIGFVLILIFMIVIYRMSGVVADLALIVYMLLVIFAMATIDGVQLTLPGIAGVILAIGMAVDANVIIYERITEEVLLGKSLRTALDMGFNRAFTAILDSNITTVIAALVLLYFGTGSIKGFAVTLLIGILASFVSAVFITRWLIRLFAQIFPKPSLYTRIGAKKGAKE